MSRLRLELELVVDWITAADVSVGVAAGEPSPVVSVRDSAGGVRLQPAAANNKMRTADKRRNLDSIGPPDPE